MKKSMKKVQNKMARLFGARISSKFQSNSKISFNPLIDKGQNYPKPILLQEISFPGKRYRASNFEMVTFL